MTRSTLASWLRLLAERLASSPQPRDAPELAAAGRRAYHDITISIEERLPLVGAALQRASHAREANLPRYETGARLGGVEDLLVYFDRAVAAYEADERLARVAFLLRRAVADFETALDATLGGYIGVAADAMRDVLEIECLLWDFTAEPHRIERWLSLPDDDRRKEFAPVKVRERMKAAGADRFTSAAEGTDYAAHSAALHVSPRMPVIGRKGQVHDPLVVDAGFSEILEHGARLIVAADMCRAVNVPDPAAASATLANLERLDDARKRAHEMQKFFLAMLEAPPKLRQLLGREPTIAEIRAYVVRALEEPH